MLKVKIAQARKRKGLTQEALAVKLNVVRQTVSKWERGEAVPDADMLCKIADALDVDVANLLGRTEFESKPIDDTDIAKTLASINEELAIKNRRARRIWKVIIIVLVVILVMIAVIAVLNILPSGGVSSSLPVNVEHTIVE